MKKQIYISLGLRCLMVIMGLAGLGLGQLQDISDTSTTNRNYKIGTGDVLNIVVTKQDTLSLNGLRVSNEGTIRMPMIKENISAACLTELQLSEVLSEKYRKYVLEPEVFVSVVEFNSNPVALMGAVNTPGRFDVRRPARVLEMLTLVNGPSQNAGQTIQIIRQNEGTFCEDGKLVKKTSGNDEELISLNLSETLKGSKEANPYVQAGDIITLPEAEAPEEAYVIGNVVRAEKITLDQPTTISMAIAMAGGVTRGAETGKIKIIRQNPETLEKSEIIVNLKEIRSQSEKDILLMANDIVEVPGPSGAKKFFGDIFRTIVPVFSRGIVPVY